MKKLTIFTPTYNRAYTLPTLYESLLLQTNKSFIWLIVDDGSSDNTEELVNAWKKENCLEIIYVKQQNAGKMAAHNKGVQYCKTELFCCVDSDDYLANDAVETILSNENIGNERNIAGFIAYKGKNNSEPIGNRFPEGLITGTLSGLYDQGFKGDTTLVFKSDVIAKYPFPLLKGEKFITEAYSYDQIDRSYQYRLIPKVLTICEYRNDGLSLNQMKCIFDNPGGWALYHCQKADFTLSSMLKFKHYAWAISYKLMKRGEKLNLNPNCVSLYYLSYPLGLLLYLRRIVKYSHTYNK